MKKSIAAVSAIILISSVILTSCGKTNTYYDVNGNEHEVVTQKGGSPKQDEYGNLYEVVTDAEGKTTKTQVVEFPEVYTNKNESVAENSVIKMKIPKGWKLSGGTSKMSVQHYGECYDTDSPKCEITFSSDIMLGVDDLYEDSIDNARWLTQFSGECSDLKEYETEILGQKAKAYSYKFDSTGVTCYNFFFQKEIPSIHIEAYAYKDCYTEEELIELINESCTLKDLGGEKPTTTTTTTAESTSN